MTKAEFNYYIGEITLAMSEIAELEPDLDQDIGRIHTLLQKISDLAKVADRKLGE